MKVIKIVTIQVFISMLCISANCYAGSYTQKVIERGNEFFQQGKYDEAIREFTFALMIGPYNSQAYYNRGRAFHAMGEFDDAISDYSIAIQIDPDNAEIYHNRANLHYYKSELDLAIDDWSRSVRLCPDCYQSYDNRAYAYYEKGLYDLAQEDVDRLKELGYKVSQIFVDILTRRAAAEDLIVIERCLKYNPSQKYLISIPKNYNPETKTPLFIAIHKYPGDVKYQINIWKSLANQEGYILLHPVFAPGYQNFLQAEDSKLVQIIKELKEEFMIDEKKIFLIGFSEGARFVQQFAFRFPKYVKVACLLSGREYELNISSYGMAKKINFFIGAGETGKRYSEALNFYNQLKENGYKVKLEFFPLLGYRFNSKIKYAVIDFLREIK